MRNNPVGCIRQGQRQAGQPVAGEHQLLQPSAVADLGGQAFQLVIGKDQPAQSRRQGIGRQMTNTIGLEADHFQLRAIAEALRHLGERVVRAEQDPQLAQPG